MCIYILLFHGGQNKDFPSLSPFNSSIHPPFIATPRFLTFYLITFPPSIPGSRKYFMHMFKRNSQLKFLHLFLLEIFKQYVKHYLTFFSWIEYAFISFPMASRNVPVWLNVVVIFTYAVRKSVKYTIFSNSTQIPVEDAIPSELPSVPLPMKLLR